MAAAQAAWQDIDKQATAWMDEWYGMECHVMEAYRHIGQLACVGEGDGDGDGEERELLHATIGLPAARACEMKHMR